MCMYVNAHKHTCTHTQMPLVEQEEKERKEKEGQRRSLHWTGRGMLSAARDRKPTISVLSGSAYIFLL